MKYEDAIKKEKMLDAMAELGTVTMPVADLKMLLAVVEAANKLLATLEGNSSVPTGSKGYVSWEAANLATALSAKIFTKANG